MSKTCGLLHTLRCLFKGQSLLRIRMNTMLASHRLHGKVIDIGGARSPDYFSYFMKDADVQIEAVDGMISNIDFETDSLPYSSHSADTLVCCNVLEHIYNHQHLLLEMNRVLKPGGVLIGFVPFWIGYHPDPKDYVRYTHEGLRRILLDAEFSDIEIHPLKVSPVLANFNTIVLSFPRILRPGLYVWYSLFEFFFRVLRPDSLERNPLGYVFTATHV
jgi:SAM-dependent methyltransferase